MYKKVFSLRVDEYHAYIFIMKGRTTLYVGSKLYSSDKYAWSKFDVSSPSDVYRVIGVWVATPSESIYDIMYN